MKKLVVIAALLALGVIGFYLPPSTYRAASLLKIAELPASAANVECWSRGWEDDFTQCIGMADIKDMPIFMTGWPFEQAGNCSVIIPNEMRHAPTHCYHYDTYEPREGGYVEFSFNENTRWFHATIYRP